jgi:hypothetical protein
LTDLITNVETESSCESDRAAVVLAIPNTIRGVEGGWGSHFGRGGPETGPRFGGTGLKGQSVNVTGPPGCRPPKSRPS